MLPLWLLEWWSSGRKCAEVAPHFRRTDGEFGRLAQSDSIMRLDGKVILVTGASEGIGAACAHLFRDRGARLSLTARNEESLRRNAGPGDLVTAGDLRDSSFRQTFVERSIDHFGRIDILVNNAGVGLYAPAWRAPLEQTRDMFELNFMAPLHLIQQVVPHMRAARSGAIVNIGSIAGKVTLPWFTLYSASKYAVGSLTDGLRMELRSFGIHTMTVCPGYVKTRFQENVIAGNAPQLTGLRKRWAITPEQCAEDIASGLERSARTVVTPQTGWVFIALERVLPRAVDRRLEQIYLEQGMNG
jgi:short-subunit dehydrogenase